MPFGAMPKAAPGEAFVISPLCPNQRQRERR
jgi:hypothetical protein